MEENMRRKVVLFGLILTMIGKLLGCGTEYLGNMYMEGQDYQYMLDRKEIFAQIKAKGTQGYFFLQGHYIFYLDDETKTLVPFCIKADCLHNKETNEEKYSYCNAYVDGFLSDAGIAFYDGYLYVYSEEKGEAFLRRIKEDGTERDIVYTWKTPVVNDWIIHRGVFYYAEQYNVIEDGETVKKHNIKAIDLSAVNKKEKVIFTPPKEDYVLILENLTAYGNYLYFEYQSSITDDIELLLGENSRDYTKEQMCIYSIENKTIEELRVPNQTEDEIIQEVCFWNDRLVIQVYDFANEDELRGKENIYSIGLDGSDAKVLLENEYVGKKYFSDGNYLYASNSSLVMWGWEEKQYYTVYNKNMEVVDIIAMPFETAGDPEIGTSEELYIFMATDDEDRAELKRFDKTTIGKYNGEPYELEKIADWYISPLDREANN